MTMQIKAVAPAWRKAAYALRGRLKPAMQAHHLTKMDGKIVMIIKRSKACTKAELAKLLICEPASLTRSLDRLVEQGLIYRFTDTDDKRFVRIALTDHGDTIAKSVKKATIATWRKALKGVAPRDLRGFLTVLEKIVDNLEGNK
ncbi:MAG: MarR family transcriptional regulator [Gammaproteobacteria bacterium]|nr:MarR family transcriptional regulator [Gammaproteobacteria bacterium]